MGKEDKRCLLGQKPSCCSLGDPRGAAPGEEEDAWCGSTPGLSLGRTGAAGGADPGVDQVHPWLEATLTKEYSVLAQFLEKLREKGLALISGSRVLGFSVSIRV